MTLELADGRGELFQWDAGRIIEFGDDTVSQAHFTSIEKITDIPYTIVVKNRKAAIPDELLQVPGTLIVYAWVSDTNGGYTKVQVNFPVFARPKPADYVYTPTEHAGFDRLRTEIGNLSALKTDAKDNLVAAINEAARTGGGESDHSKLINRDAQDQHPIGAIAGLADALAGKQPKGDYLTADKLQSATDAALAQAKASGVFDGDPGPKGDPGETGPAGPRGPAGAPGKDGNSPVVTATKSGRTTTISVDGAAIATVEDGADGAPGKDGTDGKPGAAGADGAKGADGITPTIGDNGNWYIGDDDTGKPSRGEQGPGAEVYYVDLAGTYPSYTCATAMADIAAAYASGKELKCRFAIGVYTAVLPLFLPKPSANTWIFSGAGALSAMGFPAQTMTIAIVNGTVQASDTRLASMDDIPTIPTALKNPNALTIKIGGTTVTYDGSAAKTVEIADGSEVSY